MLIGKEDGRSGGPHSRAWPPEWSRGVADNARYDSGGEEAHRRPVTSGRPISPRYVPSTFAGRDIWRRAIDVRT